MDGYPQRMTVPRWLVMYLLGLVSAMAEPAVITGVRDWHLTDGRSRRLKLIQLTADGKFAYFQDGRSKGPIPAVPVDSLVPEERALLADVHAGRVTLCKVKGLNMTPVGPSGKVRPDDWPGGDVREWRHVNGRTITARLVNLADDEVSLLVKDTVSKVAIRDLSAGDAAYLDKLKRGAEEVVLSAEATLYCAAWDGSPSFRAEVSHKKYVALADLGSGFEDAMRAALKEAEEKLPEGAWQFVGLEEREAHKRPLTPADEKVPWVYVATFALEPSAYRVARELWPLSTTPQSFPGPRELWLILTAEGEILVTKPSATKP
jgi:hypothetical protein